MIHFIVDLIFILMAFGYWVSSVCVFVNLAIIIIQQQHIKILIRRSR